MVALRKSSLPALAGPKATSKSEMTFCPSSGAHDVVPNVADAVAARVTRRIVSSSRGHNWRATLSTLWPPL
jgi:hypothetical protein